MIGSDLVMYEEEFRKIDAELQKLHQQSNSKVVFLVDKNGQLIASAGETHDIDTTSLASLTAGNIAATGGIARLLGEKEKSEGKFEESPFAEISDEDIDSLFR